MVANVSVVLCFVATMLAFAAANELKVTQYEGPTECGDADKVKKGDQLGMHYTGTIDASSKTGTPGKQFDSSRGRSIFETKIGVGQVIPGWDEGLIGLCKGAKATLVIPPHKGYGDSGAGGDIPGGATLNFDVEVVSVAEGKPEPNLFVELDTDKDSKLTQEEVLAYFKKQGRDQLPDGLFESEDKNKDGHIDWDEFGGPKGAAPPDYKDEL
jgi:FKBP-type peptidyl-prolyl cis-trans isomerase 2